MRLFNQWTPRSWKKILFLLLSLCNLIIADPLHPPFVETLSGNMEQEWLKGQLRQNPDETEAAPRMWFGPLMAGMGQAVQPILLMLGLHSALMMFPQMVQKAIAPKYNSFFRWRRDMDRMSPRVQTAWKLLQSGWERYEQLPQPIPYQF